MSVWLDGGDFLANLTADEEVTRRLDAGALAKLFDPAWHTRRVDDIFSRVFGKG